MVADVEKEEEGAAGRSADAEVDDREVEVAATALTAMVGRRARRGRDGACTHVVNNALEGDTATLNADILCVWVPKAKRTLSRRCGSTRV